MIANLIGMDELCRRSGRTKPDLLAYVAVGFLKPIIKGGKMFFPESDVKRVKLEKKWTPQIPPRAGESYRA